MSFSPVEFVISADYLGHEPLDTFSAQATVPGTDGSDWLVEFHNGSGEWNSSMSFDMGLDGGNEFGGPQCQSYTTKPDCSAFFNRRTQCENQLFHIRRVFRRNISQSQNDLIHGFSVTSLNLSMGCLQVRKSRFLWRYEMMAMGTTDSSSFSMTPSCPTDGKGQG